MLFATTFLLLAPAVVLAIPTQGSEFLGKRGLSSSTISTLEDGNCDLSQAAMPQAPTPLPSPSAGLTLAHVAIGRGIQNYTCSQSSASVVPKAMGALATLFNATCTAVRAAPLLNSMTELAMSYPIPSNDIANVMQSGHHEFNSAGSPFFDLVTDHNNYGAATMKSLANSSAPATASAGPNGLGSVAWLKLTATSGDLKEVYRVNTAGGVAPKTCDGISGVVSVQYAAEYWFYK